MTSTTPSRSLSEEFAWNGRSVRWESFGDGPPIVFCHGTPWSSDLWRPFASALADRFTVYLWDMPGYGQSSKDPGHAVSLDVQGELFADLLNYWSLDAPHVVAHDYGGAVALRAHLLSGSTFASLALIDVVALAPWGSPFFRLIGDHSPVFNQLPGNIHSAVVAAYIESATHRPLPDHTIKSLTSPWLGEEGQPAFYRQIAQADQRFTDEVEPLYSQIDIPVAIMWGEEDPWIPVDRAHRLAELIPHAQLHLIAQAGHLIQVEAPVPLASKIGEWLSGVTSGS